MTKLVDQYGRELEARATSNLRDPDGWLLEAFGINKSTSGERVSPKLAMNVTAFYACVRNISEDLTKLPMGIKQKRGRERYDLPDHPVARLVRNPSRIMNRHVFWQTYFAHALSTHGGFAYIVRDGAGRPVELILLDPLAVSVLISQDDGLPYFHVAGMKAHEVLMPSEVLHTIGLSYSGVDGYTVSQLAREVLGVAIALQKYRGAFFANGATAAGILSHPAELTEAASKRLRDQWARVYGSGQNAHGIITLEEGMSFTPISIDPERAQLSALLSSNVEEILRLFRMPPHKAGHLERSTNNNIEHQGLEYDRDTLDPWADKWRAEVDFKLLTDDDREAGIYPFLNMNALMRADVNTRAQFYKEMFYLGVYSPNDIRELEDLSPVPEGERRYIQRNLIPSDRVDDTVPDPSAAQPTNQPASVPGDPAAAFRRMLEIRINDILRLEQKNATACKSLDAFYKRHRAHVEAQMALYLAAIIDGLGMVGNAPQLAADYATVHCQHSIRDINANDYTEWTNGQRATDAAASLMEEITCSIAA